MSARSVSIEDVEANVLYMMSQAMDLILRDADRRMRGRGGEFKREKKQLFRRYSDAVRTACVISERLGDDVIASACGKGFRDFDLWREESNELARLILLFADKSSEDGASDAIFGYLQSFKGAGIIDNDTLDKFRLK